MTPEEIAAYRRNLLDAGFFALLSLQLEAAMYFALKGNLHEAANRFGEISDIVRDRAWHNTDVAAGIHNHDRTRPKGHISKKGYPKLRGQVKQSWTQAEDDRIIQLWGEGNTASHIAKLIGDRSRSAVLGRLNRLGYTRKE